MTINPKQTARTRARYNRLAPFYDWLGVVPELCYSKWRRQFWARVASKLPASGRLLEVGVGTGKNMPYWPAHGQVTGIDLAPQMLVRAQQQAQNLNIGPQLELGDAQNLRFPDNSFDVAAMTFVMCSVPDPVLGLTEIARVVRPGGYLLMMEHVRSPIAWIGTLMDMANPIFLRLMGPNINRDTVKNAAEAGLRLLSSEDLGLGGVFICIESQVPSTDDREQT
jgi:ubiquinone/menaquinone biosynthesis C-methylase UbiE